MKEKYFEALCAIGEVLIDVKNEGDWKDTQLTMKNEEINKLKEKIKEIEKYIEDNRV